MTSVQLAVVMVLIMAFAAVMVSESMIQDMVMAELGPVAINWWEWSGC